MIFIDRLNNSAIKFIVKPLAKKNLDNTVALYFIDV